MFKDQYPYEIFIFQERGTSLWQFDWRSKPVIGWNDRKELCRQLLERLSEIHRLGWMHRDITPANVLVFQQPLRAALCDYGKLCQEPRSNVTTLAAWTFLPQELKPEKSYTYDQKIDIWLLGHTLLSCWFPKEWMHKKQLRDRAHHNKILALLAEPAKFLQWRDDDETQALVKDPEARKLALLIRSMVSWDTSQRPSAEEALDQVSPKAGEQSETSSRKHPRSPG